MLGVPLDGLDQAIAAAEAEVADLAAQTTAVSEHLARLRSQRTLGFSGSPDRVESPADWPPMRKVELFRSLFRGREELFAARWENAAKGRAGYAPRCANEWQRGVCEKPRIRCGACPNQAFVPADAQAVLAHLRGRQVIGIYPLLADETCWLLAIDLDGAAWSADVAALREACDALGITPVVERSRSGAGAHIWFFFAAPVPADRARALGTLLLTRAMARCPTMRMDSYDRLFHSQANMTAGGFGNLIALPLQHAARQSGNTVFLDEQLEAYEDQWAFLAQVKRITLEHLGELVTDVDGAAVVGVAEPPSEERRPWRAPKPLSSRLADVELPATVNVTLAQGLYVERAALPAPLLDAARRLAAFANPVFGERQAMRLSTALTPRVIACFEDLPEHLVLPRGCADGLGSLLEELGIELVLSDERTDGVPVELSFTGSLSEPQSSAVGDVLRHDIGVLCAPPGAGKTVMGASLVAARGRSTLVLVHRKQLVEQWVAQLGECLALEPGTIGTIGGGRRTPSGLIDVATVQTLARAELDHAARARYGHIVIDECHHVPAVSVERLLGSFPARYVTGLTATPYRRDGHQPIISMQCGPTRHTMVSRAGDQLALRVIRRDTAFDPAVLPTDPGIQEIYSALAVDENRLQLITEDALAMLEEGRSPIILTERREHLERLAERLSGEVPALVTLHGDVTPRRRREALARSLDRPRLVLATGRFIGEGFDDPRLDTLLLAMPIAWKGTVVQYAGRLHRAHPGKSEARIYDYVDSELPVLRRMFAKRAKAYRTMDYTIDSASAHDLRL
jgi:superfamily II DNA or RNA helicase